jgi:hypothetical protein
MWPRSCWTALSTPRGTLVLKVGLGRAGGLLRAWLGLEEPPQRRAEAVIPAENNGRTSAG